jgi:hypothetical protein
LVPLNEMAQQLVHQWERWTAQQMVPLMAAQLVQWKERLMERQWVQLKAAPLVPQSVMLEPH